MSRFSG
jgi:hypothetical protein